MTKIIERVIGNATHELPANLSREIGRILVRFAYFEQCVQEMVWDTMTVSEAVGRIAVREPRVTDRLAMVRELIGMRQASWNEVLYKSVYSRSNLLVAKRHLLQ